MDRRSFLSRAALAVSALTLDSERLIWQPKKTIFIPAPKPDLSLWAMQKEMYQADLTLIEVRVMSLVIPPDLNQVAEMILKKQHPNKMRFMF